MNYQHHYHLLITRARTRILTTDKERHHIIPRCLGGLDTPDNLVDLTYEEHYVAHQLLVRIHPTESKLVHAAMMMTMRRPSNKIYGWLRRRYVTIAKGRVGEKNNAFGTMWVNDGTKAFMVPKNTVLPAGVKIGRSVRKLLCETCGVEITDGKVAKFCKQHRVYMKPDRLAKLKKPPAVIEKNGELKTVPRNQVPSYLISGWKRHTVS